MIRLYPSTLRLSVKNKYPVMPVDSKNIADCYGWATTTIGAIRVANKHLKGTGWMCIGVAHGHCYMANKTELSSFVSVEKQTEPK